MRTFRWHILCATPTFDRHDLEGLSQSGSSHGTAAVKYFVMFYGLRQRWSHSVRAWQTAITMEHR